MNLVSVTVSAAVMATIAPGVAQMSIAPIIAQKRAANFSIAEASAVAYAARNEGLPEPQAELPEGCTLAAGEDSNAWSVTCVHGQQFKQSVTRSFITAELSGSGTGIERREYTPGVFCPLWDPWGIINYNDSHNVQCIPVPYGPWASTYTGEMLW